MEMRIRRLWPLFLGLAILGLCVGIQGTLLGVRASMEGFGTRAVGLIMSGYFLGFILGAVRAPRAIRRVGHVRTFGALTALASISVLVHPLVIEPWTWFFLRVVTGFAFSGIYVVAESWLNHASNQENRGRVLSLYATVLFAGLGGGQLLLGLLDAESYEVFSWVSVLISFAAIPILIFTTPAPVAEEVTRVSVRRLFQWAPYGVVSVFLAQVGGAVLVGMGAVYAHSLQMDLGQISLR